MSSRFTETLKWEDSWFRKLTPAEKLLFNYICDKCDIAGFWEIDLELAGYFMGIEKTALLGAFEGLNRGYLKNGEYIWLKNFLRHQRNLPLNPENNAHKAIINILNNHTEFHEDFEKEALFRGSLGAKEPPCKGIVKVRYSKGIVKGKGGVGGKPFKPPTLEDVKKYISKNPELSAIDAEDFWKGYADGGWIDTQGKKVRNWKLKLRTRVKFAKERKSNGTNGQNRLPKSSPKADYR